MSRRKRRGDAGDWSGCEAAESGGCGHPDAGAEHAAPCVFLCALAARELRSRRRVGCEVQCCVSSQRSASMAAMHPEPAAEMAWR